MYSTPHNRIRSSNSREDPVVALPLAVDAGVATLEPPVEPTEPIEPPINAGMLADAALGPQLSLMKSLEGIPGIS